MRNIVFQIRGGLAGKSKRGVKAFQIGLRLGINAALREMRAGVVHGKDNDFAPQFFGAMPGQHQHAPQMHAVAVRNQAAVGDDFAVLLGEDVQRG